MMRTFRIGIDYHGVITSNPQFFKEFTQAALKENVEIYILSGGFTRDIKPYLDMYSIVYSHIWSMADYFENKRQLIRLSNGTFQVDDELWNKAKAEYCLEHKIDFHIDDSAVYGKHFATPFCLYDAKTHTCANNETVIDFTKTPKMVLHDILKSMK